MSQSYERRMTNMVPEPQIVLNASIIKYIDNVLEDNNLPENVKKELELFSKKFPVLQSIPFRLVKTVYQYLNKDLSDFQGKKKVYLHELIQGSDLVLPAITIPQRDPELEARVQRLKADLQNKEYREITRNVDFTVKEKVPTTIRDEVQALNKQLLSVFNFLVTVGGAFAFGYKATEYALEGQGNTFPAQLIIGLIMATLVFFADLYFLVKYDGIAS